VQSIRLHGLSAARSYTVRNVRTGELVGTFGGEQLASKGVPVELAAPYSAAVLAIDPA
jgi:hypothetical protein